jgi:hypothetical protein
MSLCLSLRCVSKNRLLRHFVTLEGHAKGGVALYHMRISATGPNCALFAYRVQEGRSSPLAWGKLQGYGSWLFL